MEERKSKRKERVQDPNSRTLCWDCKHATDINYCPWVRDGTPVEGWWARSKAIQYLIYPQDAPAFTREIDSYCVICCPLFDRDSFSAGLLPMEKKRTEYKYADSSDIKALCAAIITQAIADWNKLDRGRFAKALAADGQTIKRDEVVEFFYSAFFEEILDAVSSLTPAKVREELGIYWL